MPKTSADNGVMGRSGSSTPVIGPSGRVDRWQVDGLTYRRPMCMGYVARMVTNGQAGEHHAGERPATFGGAGSPGAFTRGAFSRGSRRAESAEWALPPARRTAIRSPGEARRVRSRFGRGRASFRHRRGIRFCKICDLTSHFSSAGAKLCEPGDHPDRHAVASLRWGCGPLEGRVGMGIAADVGISVGWEAG